MQVMRSSCFGLSIWKTCLMIILIEIYTLQILAVSESSEYYGGKKNNVSR